MSIGKVLNELLKKRNMRVSELAELVDIPASTIYSILRRDNSKIDIEAFFKICDVLGVSPEIFSNFRSSGKQVTVEIQPAFSFKLQTIMSEKGISQVELSHRLGLERSTVNKWLMKKSFPRISVIEKLASVLDVNTSYFFENNSADFSLTDSELYIIEKYRLLDSEGKSYVMKSIRLALLDTAQSAEKEKSDCI